MSKRVLIELLDSTILVDEQHFIMQATKPPPANEPVEDEVVRLLARAIACTPPPTNDSLSLELDRFQLITIIAVSATMVSSLRRDDYGLGVYGQFAIMPCYDDDYGFWITDLETGALVAANLRNLEEGRVVVNSMFCDLEFFEQLAVFVAYQVDEARVKFDAERVQSEWYRSFVQKLSNMVDRMRRENNS